MTMTMLLMNENPVWVVTTQYLENYGSTDKTNAYAWGWKIKFGNTYCVEGLSSSADAMALVQLGFAIEPNPKSMEVVKKAEPYDSWIEWLRGFRYEHEANFYRESAIHIHLNEKGEAHIAVPLRNDLDKDY